MASFFDGSYDGLTRLADKNASIRALYMHESTGWNIATASDKFANLPMVLVDFCKRDRGMLVSVENLLAIREISDLKRL